MTLKKENVNHDLGQYIFTNYVSPLYINTNGQQSYPIQQQTYISDKI
jgi:hypothetical protein